MFPEHGTYIIHRWSSSLLRTGNNTWLLGPGSPVEVECACNVSDHAYVVVGSNDRNNVFEYSITKAAWEAADTWPEMRTKRKGPGCAATSQHLLVAGGVTGQGEVLSSVEIFSVDFKSIGRAANMWRPRSFFSLIPVGLIRPRLLAIGGRDELAWIRSTEFFEEENNQWEQGPQLKKGQASFGSTMIPRDLVCSKESPSYSCPTTDDDKMCDFSLNQGITHGQSIRGFQLLNNNKKHFFQGVSRRSARYKMTSTPAQQPSTPCPMGHVIRTDVH